MYNSKIKEFYGNHCCSGKAVGNTHSQYVFVALLTQHAVHLFYIVICGVPGSTTFFHFISYRERFSEKKDCWT